MSLGGSSGITLWSPETGVFGGSGPATCVITGEFPRTVAVTNYRFKTDTLNCIQTPCYPGQILKSWELGSCKGQWQGVTMELVANVDAVACMELHTIRLLFYISGVPVNGWCENVSRICMENPL